MDNNKVGLFGNNLQPFIGQIPLGQTDNKTDPNGWADRYKVRIQGIDPKEGSILSNDNLRWGYAVRSTSLGNGNKGSVGLAGGETVFGLYDVDNQLCYILGSLARSNYNIEMNAQMQQTQQSLEFKLGNIFNSKNPAQGWSYKNSGSTGNPRGQQPPFQPSIEKFNDAKKLLGSS